MVLTDILFDRCSVLHSRYDLIRRPDSAPIPVAVKSQKDDSIWENKDYAAFLKSQERRVGPTGFLDSNRFTNTFTFKRDKDVGSPTGKDRLRATSDSVVTLTSRIQKDEKDYQKRMKIIEDHMWQHKQEERELKRVEGDIIKNQRAVRQALRNYGNEVNRKQLAEEKKLNLSLDCFTKMSRNHVHAKEEKCRLRSQHSAAQNLTFKDQASKMELHITDLEHQYNAKRAAIELKRAEVMRLSQEFEAKMRQKEAEQYKLKNELAELSITLNLEAQKSRVQKHKCDKNKKREKTQQIQDDLSSQKNLKLKLKKSDADIKNATMTKRKLDIEGAFTKAHLDIKKRDEQRHLTDTQIRLEDNRALQRELNDSTLNAGMDLKAKQTDHTVEAHNARRTAQLLTHMTMKKGKEAAQQELWEQRFRLRDQDARRRKHEDALDFFQKMVQSGTEQEMMLHHNVRNAEYSRQKQDQAVRRIQQALAELRRVNSQRSKQDMIDRQRSEEKLEQQLLREKAELDQIHANREETYARLQELRVKLREDKFLLQEHEREHQRLLKVGARSDLHNRA